MVAELTGHRDASAQYQADALAQDQRRLSLWVWAFIIGLIVPLFIYAGPLRLSAYRFVLLIAFFPAVYYWLSGRAGPIRLPDICVVIICLWSSLSLSVVQGLGMMFETIGILWVETLGAYLLGRCYIRTPEAFFKMAQILFWIALLLLPFAVYELLTGPSPILNFFRTVSATYPEAPQEGRLGFERVQGPFAHPIHFGVFFGAIVGLSYFVLGYGKSVFNRIQRAGLMIFLCFTSLSSGPLASATVQIVFLLWDGIMKSVRSRWYIFVGLTLLAFIVVDLLSNRTPFHVFISYFAFSEDTAYNRIRIWEFGTASIWANPLLGIGLTDNWVRPWWMSPSADMFWIVPAMRHGVVVWIAYLTLFFSIFLAVAHRKDLSDRVHWYRMGYVCTMSGLFIVGWTVHFWDALFVFFMFVLASGVWMLDWRDEDPGEQPLRSRPERTELPYSRFRSRASASPGSELPPKFGH